MRRITRILATGLGVLALAACSHRSSENGNLAYVPANTPYVFATLKPLDDATQNAMLERANAQLPMNVATMRSAAERMQKDGKTDAANLLRAFAKELDGRTVQQFAKADGLDLHGRNAFFGIGLSPVMRFDLADPAKFDAMVKRLEKAYGHDFDKASIGKVDYRVAKLDKVDLQALLAIEGKQAVIALLPGDADKGLLREALGLDKPKQSLADSGRLQKLADQRGYQPYVVGYVDFTRLPALLAGPSDPLLKALRGAAAKQGKTKPWPLTAACQPDLERMAARMPMISFGYTRLDPNHMDQRTDIDLASDISKAFSGVKVKVPGLGGGLDAPFDAALALPVKELRTFLVAQAQAVTSKPFSCPAFAKLNQSFGKMQMGAARLAMPGIADLRGIRMSVDSFTPAAPGQKPQGQGRVLIASNNPQGLLALAQSVLRPLAQLQIKNDGTPVALPAQLTAMLKQPAWLAMTDNALAIGIGSGEDAHLGGMLKAPGGDAGDLARVHLDGAMYLKWITAMLDSAQKSVQAAAAKDPDAAAAARKSLAQSRQMAVDQAKRVQSVSGDLRMTDHGLVLDSKVTLKKP
jgi:hypothetical protein